MGQVYSVRFLDAAGGPKSLLYTVPSGMRAIIRACSWATYQSPDSMVWVAVRGKYVFLQRIPGPTAGGSVDLRLVAYQGEKVTLETSGVDVGAHLAGFLFPDSSGGLSAQQLPADSQVPMRPPGPELELS